MNECTCDKCLCLRNPSRRNTELDTYLTYFYINEDGVQVTDTFDDLWLSNSIFSLLTVACWRKSDSPKLKLAFSWYSPEDKLEMYPEELIGKKLRNVGVFEHKLTSKYFKITSVIERVSAVTTWWLNGGVHRMRVPNYVRRHNEMNPIAMLIKQQLEEC